MLDESPYFAKSKSHLFIFRNMSDKTRQLQIRHQRNADVVMNFVSDLHPTGKPMQHIYNVIETLVPTSVREGRCLELFGKRQDAPRRGWTKLMN